MAKKLKRSKTTLLHLPEDTLLLILDKLNHADRSFLSLVSKYFRSLTNGSVDQLYFNADRLPSNSALRTLFTRFSSISKISIRSLCITSVLKEISNSPLKIERLKIYGKPSYPKPNDMIRLFGRLGMVKYLRLEGFSDAARWQLVEFIHLFSSLEELDLSACPAWSDSQTELLALNAPNLRTIDLGFGTKLTDRSLDALSNCVNLENVYLDLGRMTTEGTCLFLLKCKTLKSIKLPFSTRQKAGIVANSLSLCQNLSRLSIEGHFITDDSLRVIAKSSSLLTSLDISSSLISDTTYSMTGLSNMLLGFAGLTRLYLCLPSSGLDTQDVEMSHLVKSLPRLDTVHLISRTYLYATLFSLIQNCPSMRWIYLSSTVIRTCSEVPRSQRINKNYSIKHIYLLPKPYEFSLETTLKSICPEAELNGPPGYPTLTSHFYTIRDDHNECVDRFYSSTM